MIPTQTLKPDIRRSRFTTMRSKLGALALAAAVLGSTWVAVSPAGALTGAVRNGELVADGAWCWFQDPRAVHYVGLHNRTYIGYVTSVVCRPTIMPRQASWCCRIGGSRSSTLGM